MAATALTAFLSSHNNAPPTGIVYTAVLPGGCTLNCPFCFIAQRDERSASFAISPEHYIEVLRSVYDASVLGGVAIVGDEPLQQKIWPYTSTILSLASEINSPTAIISNGLDLEAYAAELERFESLKVLISLDGVGAEHDSIRRTEGAFGRISKGIGKAVALGMRDRLSIATTLMPQNRKSVHDVISYAGAQGIANVIVSPLVTTGKHKQISAHPKVLRMLTETVPLLVAAASAAGVSLKFSDEFGILSDWDMALRAAGIRIARPSRPASLIRVDAAGGVETLDTIRQGTSTGWQLPSDVADIRTLVGSIIDHFGQTRAAA